MDSPNPKKQKHGNEHASSHGTQSQSSIFNQNKHVRLEFLQQSNELKYGSVAKDVEEINTKRLQVIGILEKLQQAPIRLPYASPVLRPSYETRQSRNNYSLENIIDLDPIEDNADVALGNIGADATVVVFETGDEDGVKSFGDENSSSKQNASNTNIQQQLLPEPPVRHQDTIIPDNCDGSTEPQVLAKQGQYNMDIDNTSDEIAVSDSHGTLEQLPLIKQGHGDKNADNKEDHHEEKGKIERTIQKDDVDSYEVSCEVIPNEPQMNESNYHDKGCLVDELEDLWRDMSVALACSKTIGSNQIIVPSDENSCGEIEEACNHDFLMKDDLGIVCRVCGLIQQRIERILEYSWKKRKLSYRINLSEHRNSSDPDATSDPLVSILKVAPDVLSIHPQHSEQMRPHQVEGFNFLVKNLADESNPGGCILAHAPGSGKTFLLISFIHSFLARYPAGRPLIMLPKSVLGNWKKEFLCWQVEDIPLYDFYSSKANNRSEQLKVLKLWEENRSILLLGYQQFEKIIDDVSTESEAEMCKEKLLKVPSLVILDEGHTSRNDQTNLVNALESIKTPRKVALSGTLFQNHVKEVFNILNIVRPKFVNMQKSRAIAKRILTKMDMFGKGVRSKDIFRNVFYDLIEENFQKSNDKTRVMIIQNLRELTENVLHYYSGDNLKELPGLVDFTVLLNMSTEQDHIIKGLLGAKTFEAYAKCKAVSLHPCLKDARRNMNSVIRGIHVIDGVKTKFIFNLLSLSVAAGEKVLVFSQYVRSLDFLETLVTRMKGWRSGIDTFRLDGGLTNDQREKAVDRFNNSPDAKVFFGSIKACGEGISLVGASRVVILDVHENPAVMRQAIGRAFRPGQSKVVYCYRLVAAGTIEEDHHRTAIKKERVSKLWFEWNELSCNGELELTEVDVSDTDDRFLESPTLREDIKSLLKR